MRRRRVALTLVVAGSLAVGLSGCGDRITANRDFSAVATHSSYTTVVAQPVGYPVPMQHDVLTGWLVDTKGRRIAKSFFTEDCAYAVSSRNMKPFPSTGCTVNVGTGTNVYVAAGSTRPRVSLPDAYYGMLAPNAQPELGPGSAVMWVLPNGGGTQPFKLKILLRTWGSAPVDPPPDLVLP